MKCAKRNSLYLGNIIAGDGVRFKGRGPIQLTGRANYQKYGRALGIDLQATSKPILGIATSSG
jgi:predicted chitinase